MKTTEWHISDYIKTDEDVHNLLTAEREPYEKALKSVMVALIILSTYPKDEKISYCGCDGTNYRSMARDMAKFAQTSLKNVRRVLKKEGVPDPTETKDTQCEKSTLE